MFDRARLLSRTGVLSIVVVCIAVLTAGGYFAFSAGATVPEVNVNSEKVAIGGYDTVAYFTEGTATRGKSDFEHAWHGARWHFASATNRDLFAANPERYAPRYGGYCSMGIAIGEFSDADPQVWTIVDGKLYLNKVQRVQDIWRKGTAAYITASELNWQKHRNRLRINENLK